MSSPSSPSSFMFWNCNGLTTRLSKDKHLIKACLSSKNPDIVFLSEVRMLGEGPHQQGSASRRDKRAQEDYADFHRAFSAGGVFGAYDVKALSLCPGKRYAGTLMAVRSASGVSLVDVSYSIPGATAASAPASSSTPSSKSSGTANKLTNFFASKPSPSKKRKADSGSPGLMRHEKDGRVILAEFAHYFVLHVYAPNNGNKRESWDRRLAWDTDILRFFKKVREEGGHAGLEGVKKPVFYCGDLNVTPEPRLDTSHPAWMRAQFQKPESPENSGQPGCTPGEVSRFKQLLEEADLLDVYRQHHPDPDPANSSSMDSPFLDLTDPLFTWRGTPGKDGNPAAGRYYKKGMRIDLLLCPTSTLNMFESCEIVGAGVDNTSREFCGSDHCPVMVKMAEAETAVAKTAVATTTTTDTTTTTAAAEV